MTGGIFDLSGRVAVITGGGTGIGHATAHVLAEYGADVVIASRKVENLEQVAAELDANDHPCMIVPTDVRDADQCEALIARTIDAKGRIDILVNNAGGSWSLPFESWTLDRWQNMIDLNLRSVFVLSIAASRSMLEAGKGAIVNISSGASELGLPFVAPYGAAKAGREQPHQDVRRRVDTAGCARELHRGRRGGIRGVRTRHGPRRPRSRRGGRRVERGRARGAA